MHCNMCREENPCPDCLIDEVNHRRIPRFATQGGGIVISSFDWYIFEEVPNWGNFEVGDLMPKDWSIVPIN